MTMRRRLARYRLWAEGIWAILTRNEMRLVVVIKEFGQLNSRQRRESEGQATACDPSAEYWSYRAQMRVAFQLPDSGEMWEYDHARPLDPVEYDHWQTHTLPRGWSIIRPPAERREEATR